jgi:peroxiredoxin Q/BCP
LLSDVDHAVGEAYGTARPTDHDWAAVARRWTFLIDPAGIVRRTYDVKDFGGHPEEVLADLQALRSDSP